MYLNWFMLLYDEIPLISGGDVAEIKGKNIKDNDTFYYDKWPSDCCVPTCEQLSAIAWLKQVTFRWHHDDVRYVALKWWTAVGFYILVCIYVVICRDTVDLLYLIIIYYVLLNTRLRLVLLDHVTCDYLWQHNLWWNHYWLCNKYDLVILTPSKNKIVVFIAWISKSTNFHVQHCDHVFSSSFIKKEFEICIWCFFYKLVELWGKKL